MCIAIYKPREVIIPQADLEQSFRSNPDGAGFMFAEKGRLNIFKGYFSFQEFWEAYEPHQDKHAAIHFRIKTHGKIDEVNCHPFRVNHTLGFIHNGTISNHGTTAHSDTYMFNEEVIKPLLKRFGKNVIYDESIQALVEKYIGWSKLVFLDNYGNYQIFNESSGHWHNGAWFSNNSYKPPVPKDPPKAKATTPAYPVPMYPKSGTVKEEFYIKKVYARDDIWADDWVEINWTYQGVEKGTLAVIKEVFANGTADIQLLDGTYVNTFPGCYMTLYDWESMEGQMLAGLNNYEDAAL